MKGRIMTSINPTANWFFKIGDEIHGPITYTELQQKARVGEIGPGTPVGVENCFCACRISPRSFSTERVTIRGCHPTYSRQAHQLRGGFAC